MEPTIISQNWMRFIKTYGLTLVISILLITENAFAQENLRVTYISNNPKLPSNLIKDVIKDTDGYVWIASDGGLTRYDGEDFITFTDEFESQYLKNLYIHNDTVYVIGDRGIYKILKINNSHKVVPFLQGSTIKVDSLVYYPKSIFIDSKKTMWISEPNSILKYSANGLKRYNFEEKYRTGSYSVSFLLAEDQNGNLFAICERGYIFYYNPDSDTFVNIKLIPNISTSFTAMHILPDNKIIIGGSQGLFECEVADSFKSAKIKRVAGLKNISAIAMDSRGNYYIGTWNNGLYRAPAIDSRLTRITELEFDIISDLSICDSETIWVSSDEGLAFFQPTFFSRIELPSDSYFIESLIQTRENKILVTEGLSVYEVTRSRNSTSSRAVFNSGGSIIKSIAGEPDNLWIGFSDGFVIHSVGGSRYKIELISSESGHMLVRNLLLDKNNQLWATEDIYKGLIRIDESYNKYFYDSTKGLTSHIEVIKESEDGELYAGGRGNSSYLFRYDSSADSFQNISVSIPFEISKPLEIYDIDFSSEGIIWLASNYGLLQYRDHSSITIADSLSNANGIVKSVAADSHYRIWMGLEYGLALHDSSSFRMDFNKMDGLSNLTTTFRNSFIDDEDRLWIGTVHGLSYQQIPLLQDIKTRSPIVTSIISDNIEYDLNILTELDYHSSLEMVYQSLSYPSDRIFYQHRILNLSKVWSAPEYSNSLFLPDLSAGEYTIEIRARQTGYQWSDSTAIKFVVHKPFYLTIYAYIIYYVILLALGVFIYFFVKLRREKKHISDQLNHFFSISPDFLCITDIRGKLIYMNPAGSDFWGIGTDELKKISFEGLFQSEEKDFISGILNELRNVKSTKSFISRITDQTGNELYYQWNISASKNFERFYAVGRDLTEIKRMERELEKSVEKLSESEKNLTEINASKDKLFSIISHDLKNPFVAVLGSSEFLKDSYNTLPDEEMKEMVDMLYDSSQSVYKLLTDLLEWANLQTGKFEFSPERISLYESAIDVTELLKANAKAKLISVNVDISDEIFVFADPKTVNTLLRNLVGNAIKFTADGGNIKITSRVSEDKVFVSVIDNGIGMSKTDLEKLFKLGTHHTQKGTNNEEGTGLGLLLCKELAVKSDGDISVESEEGVGSKFTFTLPTG